MPLITSSVAPDRQPVEVDVRSHLPKPALRRLWRRMPMAWNGPVIHSSMWLRADVPKAVLTATLPLLPARSPLRCSPGSPGTSSWLMPL